LKLGEDCKSIFSKLYSASNKPFILENGYFCGENHGLTYRVSMAENNRVAQVVSGSFFSSHVPLLAAQVFV